ncbi:SMODS domain-containing nucleotidyltransferase [Tardiphaga sp. 172_B4_N1_3]|uniref:SMODS domain-containing nucleotidyltransferase n=1 Tax=Tardiphaga sp. 172_B4_N1_3 TaxID=3240787 RepID=UPI003F8C502B
MWKGVQQRFELLNYDLLLKSDEFQDGLAKQLGIRQKLQKAYYGHSTDDPPGFVVGSWGKGTQVRPPKDLDLFFVLPSEVFSRIEARAGNKQSALLQEIRAELLDKYTQSDLRADGQVVLIAFNSLAVEVVPVFAITNNQFVMPDTNDGGRWKIVDPIAQIKLVDTTDTQCGGNARNLARMVKLWKRENNVPLKSFVLELLVVHFLRQHHNASRDFFWYDWLVRDFFIYLGSLVGGQLTLPGTGDVIQLGTDWARKAETATEISSVACSYEYNDWTIIAGEEWQKIFGTRIRVHVS